MAATRGQVERPSSAARQLEPSPSFFHTITVATHQIHKCSAPASPRPHSGQGPKCDGANSQAESCPLPLWAAGYPGSASGMKERGRHCHGCSTSAKGKHSAHHARPGSPGRLSGGEGERHATAISPLPHARHWRGLRCELGRQRAAPGRPLHSSRRMRAASVADGACPRVPHSRPSPGAHRLDIDLPLVHRRIVRR